MRTLPDLQPGDSVRVKLDQQKRWKMPGKVIVRSTAPRSYIIQTPFSMVRRNHRHLRTVTSPGRFEMPDEQDLDLEPESQAEGSGSGSPHAKPEELPQTMKPCRVTPAVPSLQTHSPVPLNQKLGPQAVAW